MSRWPPVGQWEPSSWPGSAQHREERERRSLRQPEARTCYRSSRQSTCRPVAVKRGERRERERKSESTHSTESELVQRLNHPARDHTQPRPNREVVKPVPERIELAPQHYRGTGEDPPSITGEPHSVGPRVKTRTVEFSTAFRTAARCCARRARNSLGAGAMPKAQGGMGLSIRRRPPIDLRRERTCPVRVRGAEPSDGPT